ncbi:hypothetical protein [Lewinella sp. 4G2]|uniref:hypothetical protein n=1 Tax=Lewinella sp. 4G2 TaxID=1803372 RepID=UPI0007B4E8D7|nr:hypothetical protein [Lewinella sp. 4G2]OAV42908.1 hypothetical protein A3850_016930 [Lewinella sp. 4G2]
MWKNLKGYFIVDEEDGNKAKKGTGVVKPAPSPQHSATGQPASVPVGGTQDASGAVNDKFVKILMEAMEKANLPGFDYLEYKKSLQNLKKMNFTDDVRYQTAFAAAQSMGVSPQDLLKSAEHYVSALNKEQTKFGQALSGQKSQQVNDKQQRLKQLDESVAQQEAKIKELQEKIKKTKTEQQRLRGSIQQSMGKLAKTQADFEATFKVITESIKVDVENIKNYLK